MSRTLHNPNAPTRLGCLLLLGYLTVTAGALVVLGTLLVVL